MPKKTISLIYKTLVPIVVTKHLRNGSTDCHKIFCVCSVSQGQLKVSFEIAWPIFMNYFVCIRNWPITIADKKKLKSVKLSDTVSYWKRLSHCRHGLPTRTGFIFHLEGQIWVEERCTSLRTFWWLRRLITIMQLSRLWLVSYTYYLRKVNGSNPGFQPKTHWWVAEVATITVPLLSL